MNMLSVVYYHHPHHTQRKREEMWKEEVYPFRKLGESQEAWKQKVDDQGHLFSSMTGSLCCVPWLLLWCDAVLEATHISAATIMPVFCGNK